MSYYIIMCILQCWELPEVELSQSILWAVSGLAQDQASYFARGEDLLLLLGPE